MGRFQGPPKEKKKSIFQGPPYDLSIEDGPMEDTTVPSGTFQGPEDVERVDLSKVPGVEETNRVLKEYNDSPEYMKALQAADDIVRLFSTGAAYGATDTLGDDETRRMTQDARTRAGYAGDIAEFAGGMASPATRLIGAGAKALSPVGKGIWNWLGRALTTSGEGATIGGLGALGSGRPEDIGRDAAIGAILPHGVKAVTKLGTAPIKHVGAWLANKSHRDYSTAFRAGHTGNPDITDAFREGISKQTKIATGKGTKAAYDAGKKLTRGTPSQRSVQTALNLIMPTGVGIGTSFINPMAAGLPLLALALGSPRLGGEIAHAAGTVMGGLDMLGSRAAQSVIPYEQYKRRREKK